MKTALFLVLIFSFLLSQSQSINESWARTAGGTSFDSATVLAVDHHGGVYVGGNFRSSTFSIGNTVLNNSGNNDIFIAKYDTSGNFLWAKKYGGAGNERVRKMSLSIDGSLYITDTFTNTINLGAYTLTASGGTASYFAKLDNNGDIQWVKQINNTRSADVSADLHSSVYLVGGFSTPTLTISGSTINLSAVGNTDCFLVKYSADGSFQYLENAFQNFAENLPGAIVSTDNSANVHICLFPRGTPSVGGQDGQWRRWFDSTGQLLGSQVMTSTSWTSPSKTFFYGYKAKTATEYYHSAEYTPSGSLDNNLFIGNNVSPYVSYSGGCAYKKPVNTDLDNLGNQFTAGRLDPWNPINMGCVNVALYYYLIDTIYNVKGSDIFIVWNTNTKVLRLASTLQDGNTNEYSSRIAVDTSDHSIYVAGAWQKILDTSKFYFGNSILTNPGNAGTSDMLLLKYRYAVPTLSVNAGLDKTICAGGSVTIGNPANGGAGSYIYNWSPATGLSNASIATPVAHPAANTNYIVTVTDALGAIAKDTVTITIDSNLYRPTISLFGGQNPFCPGTQISLNCSAASSYLWSTGEAVQTIFIGGPDTITVTATRSDGCTGTSLPYIAIMKPRTATPAISPAPIAYYCPGSSVTLTAQDSESPVNFFWTIPGATATGPTLVASYPGNFSVTATGPNGCVSLPASVNVQAQAIPTVNSVANSSYCNGALAPAINFSGTGSFTVYNWTSTKDVGFGLSGTGNIPSYTATNTASLAITATVTVTPTANGCSGTSTSFDVTVNPTLTGTISSSGNTSFCYGDSVSLTLNTAAGNSFQWSTGAQSQNIWVKSPGTYSVQLTSPGGCTSTTNQINVTVFPEPIASFTQTGNVLTASQNSISYQWYLNGSAIAGATTQSLTISEGGLYTLKVTDNHNCSNTFSNDAVLRAVIKNLAYQVYPNPATKNLSIVYTLTSPQNVSVRIENFDGRKILILARDEMQVAGEHSYSIPDISKKFQKGIYFVQIIAGETIITRKLLIL